MPLLAENAKDDVLHHFRSLLTRCEPNERNTLGKALEINTVDTCPQIDDRAQSCHRVEKARTGALVDQRYIYVTFVPDVWPKPELQLRHTFLQLSSPHFGVDVVRIPIDHQDGNGLAGHFAPPKYRQ
ncbi:MULTISPECIES: hypothetical protein [unclassified Mesorhizobium]|uniref:hypothetical protein n=1 Tax=unclassified Mesorhizobium TaxID=325217 RepID=UPI000FD59F43|nr:MULTISPECIES: hypothetical protein [unclassified Mesorhizobium]RUV95748.1 hypothetical protein EOA88_03690 [Mesorhizobium sp. M5C.F.Ca.IN.020.14.1.1]RUV31661.1 hypothetical protein EOA86_05670 [Mesorhizobium sp. M5C.F.Ca.IN.020.32.2.1]RWG51808.1 MAG: hypothetical protein EOQ62_00660 [Mesorhizobium sp.]RWH51108.1 MAG: hypothetical protein EOQ80_01840 [Mesorhizobium sp.]RWH59114.1 MAG: hypothetical protein EOQ82_04525 [Mesorhizobium sp.]